MIFQRDSSKIKELASPFFEEAISPTKISNRSVVMKINERALDGRINTRNYIIQAWFLSNWTEKRSGNLTINPTPATLFRQQ